MKAIMGNLRQRASTSSISMTCHFLKLHSLPCAFLPAQSSCIAVYMLLLPPLRALKFGTTEQCEVHITKSNVMRSRSVQKLDVVKAVGLHPQLHQQAGDYTSSCPPLLTNYPCLQTSGLTLAPLALGPRTRAPSLRWSWDMMSSIVRRTQDHPPCIISTHLFLNLIQG
jgi:hypothetical protein